MAPEYVLLFECENEHWLFLSFGARLRTAGCLLPGCLRAERGQAAREEASDFRNLWFVRISAKLSRNIIERQ